MAAFCLGVHAFSLHVFHMMAFGDSWHSRESMYRTGFSLHQFAAALRTGLAGRLGFFFVCFDLSGIAAGREIRAGNELAIAADPVDQITAAYRAFLACFFRLDLLHLSYALIQQRCEASARMPQRSSSSGFAFRDLIQLCFHLGGVFDVDDAGEELIQFFGCQLALVGREEYFGFCFSGDVRSRVT